MTVTMSLLGGAIFQSLSIERFWVDDVKATRDLRHIGTWLARDGLNAQDILDPNTTISLANGGAPVSSAMFTYVNGSDECIEVTYSVDGNNDLIRSAVGVSGTDCAASTLNASKVLASHVVSASFARVDNKVIATVEVQAEEGTTDTLTYEAFMRRFE